MRFDASNALLILSAILGDAAYRVIGDRSNIGALQDQIEAVQQKEDFVRTDVDALAKRLEKLSLICVSLWTLLKEKSGLSDDDLIQRVRTMEQEIGAKATATFRCPKCRAVISAKLNKCQFCGYQAAPAVKGPELLP
jgi:lysyl-tRNA synthetase class II